MESAPYLTVPRLDRIPWLVHGFGTRHGKLKDLKKQPGWKDFKTVLLKQTHSDRVHFLASAPKGRRQGDAMATASPRLLLIIKTADCLPVFLIDETKRVVAAVHCGWRGTRKRILEHVVDGLRLHFGCRPASLLAALGPCISAPCYEVGEEVRNEFRAADLTEDVFQPVEGRPGKFLFDLREANRRQLIDAGLEARRVLEVSLCTHCDTDLLSFRRDRDRSGRLYNFIGMKS
jgi:YfiH family protein